MVNKNYIRGSTFERKIVHKLLDLGASIVVKGAGSKSYGKIKVDIIAIFKGRDNQLVVYAPLVLVIQAKSGKYNSSEEFLFISGCDKLQLRGLFLTPNNYIDRLEKIVKYYT